MNEDIKEILENFKNAMTNSNCIEIDKAKRYYDAIENLQEENRQLKSLLENQSKVSVADHKYASSKEDEVIELQQQLKQSNDVIDEIENYLDGACEMSCYTKSLSLDSENIDDLYDIVNKRGGTDG